MEVQGHESSLRLSQSHVLAKTIFNKFTLSSAYMYDCVGTLYMYNLLSLNINDPNWIFYTTVKVNNRYFFLFERETKTVKS